MEACHDRVSSARVEFSLRTARTAARTAARQVFPKALLKRTLKKPLRKGNENESGQRAAVWQQEDAAQNGSDEALVRLRSNEIYPSSVTLISGFVNRLCAKLGTPAQ